MIPYLVLDQISLGPLKLYTWGLFVGLGFSAGYLLFYYLARKDGLAPKKIIPLCGSIFFGAILGARLLALIIAGGGAMFMGGLIGAILFGWGYIKITNSPPLNLPLLKGEKKRGLFFWRIADLLVLPAALGIGIGRIGCILINDHQGAPTGLPWGILWPDGILHHPVGIYESLVGFGLFIIFWFIQKKLLPERSAERSRGAESKADPSTRFTCSGNDGSLFLLSLLFYSAIRFFLEFTRVSSGPLSDPRWGILSVSQWLAVSIFLISLLLFCRQKSSQKTAPERKK